jgi:hypothetical protein
LAEGETDWSRRCRREVRQNVAEEVRAHDDVEPLRLQHELRGQRVDVLAVRPHIRILRRALATTSSQNGCVCTLSE